MDQAFFRKSRTGNREIKLTDTEAIIPAYKKEPEVRAPLPNRRPRTLEERMADLVERKEQIAALEEEIEVERKTLLELVKFFRANGSGASDVVIQNLKIRDLIEQRSKLVNPQRWTEFKEGVTYKDVFEGRRDNRTLPGAVLQVKRRVEPIASLYVDLDVAAAESAVVAETAEAEEAKTVMAAEVAAAAESQQKAIAESAVPVSKPLTAAEGAIIGQRRTIKFKKTAPA